MGGWERAGAGKGAGESLQIMGDSTGGYMERGVGVLELKSKRCMSHV